MCRAAAFIEPDGDVPLREVAFDIAHDIKVGHESFSYQESRILIYFAVLGRSLPLG